jgi:membrane associated rhomboid family serine protease
MPAWLLWVIVAAVLGGVEMLSFTLVAGLLAVAAVAAAAVARVCCCSRVAGVVVASPLTSGCPDVRGSGGITPPA